MMHKTLSLIAALAIAVPAFAPAAWAQDKAEPWRMPGEDKVDPYTVSDANAGASPITDPKVLAAFHGKEGIHHIVDAAVARSHADPRISEIFRKTDLVRLKRTLYEQLCYVLGGGCAYSGRDMKTAHKKMGLQASDMNALVENLQVAMRQEGVPFSDQNKLLAKLAPQKRDMMER
jgi:hemoglobin